MAASDMDTVRRLGHIARSMQVVQREAESIARNLLMLEEAGGNFPALRALATELATIAAGWEKGKTDGQ